MYHNVSIEIFLAFSGEQRNFSRGNLVDNAAFAKG